MENAVDIRTVVDELKTDLEKIANSNYLEKSNRRSIFRIPNVDSTDHQRAYAPDAFSIGPFHFGKPHLKETQKIKLRYLNRVISRFKMEEQNVLEYLTEAIIKVQREALEYYDGPIEVSASEFVKILVLDGCIIIELLVRHAYGMEENDPIFSVPRMIQFLLHDLILLENQIPWMVLDILFPLTCTSSDQKPPLVYLAIEFFYCMFSTERPALHDHLFRGELSNYHILDLLRNYLILCSPYLGRHINNCEWEVEPMFSATSLEESGIIFMVDYSSSILDIRFEDGVLKIPELLVHENTDVLLRNLVSLELHCPNYEGIVTSYVSLFHSLIQTNTDMKILCDAKVINSNLELEDATQIFNHSYKEYSYARENIYGGLTREVNNYCRQRKISWRHLKHHYERRWPEYKRELKATYFSHPWAVISTIAACVLLILTFLQTLFSILHK